MCKTIYIDLIIIFAESTELLDGIIYGNDPLWKSLSYFTALKHILGHIVRGQLSEQRRPREISRGQLTTQRERPNLHARMWQAQESNLGSIAFLATSLSTELTCMVYGIYVLSVFAYNQHIFHNNFYT